MGSLKKLAGQTMWYGLSSILARFLNYLLTPYLTYYLAASVYGEMSLVYAAIPFMNVIFTYGMETTYFRYSNKEGGEQEVYNTGSLSLLFSTAVLTAALLLFRNPLAHLLQIGNHPEFVTWAVWIIALDAVSALPFARLRNQNRPRKYAFIKVAGILINIALVVFFYTALPQLAQSNPGSIWASIYDPKLGAGYVIIANVAQSAFTLLLLMPELLSVRLKWDNKLWREMMAYTLPLMIVGLGGMVNETFDRLMLGWWAPVASEAEAKAQVGIYSACYKLSILITLFIQAFRMGAEPFFFQQAKGGNAQATYARVMKFFVITICTMFLVVALYLDIWKHFITNPVMWEGLKIVPILLIANMCLGVYYNLSIWYKLSNNTGAGATITFIGAGITLLVNMLFIPYYGYMACAWATLSCYGGMMLVSYIWGQRVYPIPYDVRAIGKLFAVMLLCFFIHQYASAAIASVAARSALATVLLGGYIVYILKAEKQEFRNLPLIGKYIR